MTLSSAYRSHLALPDSVLDFSYQQATPRRCFEPGVFAIGCEGRGATHTHIIIIVDMQHAYNIIALRSQYFPHFTINTTHERIKPRSCVLQQDNRL